MAATHSDEFKRDAVRIALTSGLTRRQVASDLGIGLSTLATCRRRGGRPTMSAVPCARTSRSWMPRRAKSEKGLRTRRPR